jgi:hypothetical protein
MEEVITIRELMVLFHRTTEDVDRLLWDRDNEEYRNVVMYQVDNPLKES